jgi:TP901 family phage tail tape measure protein
MSRGFNLTAELNLRGPSNIRTVVADIRRQLGTINANVNVRVDPGVTRNINTLNQTFRNFNNTLQATNASANATALSLRNLGAAIQQVNNSAANLPANLQQINAATRNMVQQNAAATNAANTTTSAFMEFGRQSALAVRRFAAFATVTGVIYKVSNALTSATTDFIAFNQELVRVSQVTDTSVKNLGGLVAEITDLSTKFGVSSNELIKVSSTLAQAGLSARDTEKALKALALSALAPSFDNLNSTVEGSIALMRQFGISAGELDRALGSVNAVAAKFAVEAGDIITAIQRTGGVFATASKGVSEGTQALNEFMAVFTSVRATTRESAETIATGLRTIFTRIQRGDTIDALKEYGVTLTDLQGKFVGPYEAVRRLSEGLSQLDPRDLKFSRIVEELGGFRQIGKVIPLIQQFATAQAALKVAQSGQDSLAIDAATAQQSLAVQMAKVRNEFVGLVRSIGQSSGFQSFVKLSLDLTSNLIRLTDAAKGALPALGAIFALRGLSAIGQFGRGFIGGMRPNRNSQGGQIRAFAAGGHVPGSGDGDTVPAMLTPGEFVIRKSAVRSIGVGNLHRINRHAGGGSVQKFNIGGQTVRNIGYIDGDVLNDPIHAVVVRKEMERLKIADIHKYKMHLSNFAAAKRKSGDLSRLTTVHGVAGSGKSTFVQGGSKAQQADNSRLRKTNRYPILTEADILRSNQIIDSTSVAGPNQRGFLSQSDRIINLSSRTKESQTALVENRKYRDKTGQGLFGRKVGATKGASLDSGPGEAYIAASSVSGVDPKKVVTYAIGSNFSKKRTNQPTVRTPEKTAIYVGNFGPATAGHVSAAEQGAKKAGVSAKDTIVVVSGDTPIDPLKRDDQQIRTAYLPQTSKDGPSRLGMAQTVFGSRDFNVSAMPKGSAPGSIPSSFKVGDDSYIVPKETGNVAIIGDDKGSLTTDKYSRYGYSPLAIARNGISGTAARAAIMNNDIVAMKKLLTPDGFQYIQQHIKTLQRRPQLLDAILSRFQSGKGISGRLSSINSQLSELPARKTKTTPPEIIARMESLREERDHLTGKLGRRTGKMLSRIESMKMRTFSIGGDKGKPASMTEIARGLGISATSEEYKILKSRNLSLEQQQIKDSIIAKYTSKVGEKKNALSKKIDKAESFKGLKGVGNLVKDSSVGFAILSSKLSQGKKSLITTTDILSATPTKYKKDTKEVLDNTRGKAPYVLTKQGLSDPAKDYFNEAIGQGLFDGINGAVSTLFTKPGFSSLPKPAVTEGMKDKFLAGINPGAKGAFFEEILGAMRNKGSFDSSPDPNRPFDFPNYLGDAGSLFNKLGMQYVDAKASDDVATNKSMASKISGQLLLEEKEITRGTRLVAPIKKADGGHVQAMVSNGEAYIPPETAKAIGYGTLNRMNQADRNGMSSFSSGGISVFKGSGTGTSDSIGPIDLPVGSFILREAATKALGYRSGGAVRRVKGFSDGGKTYEAVSSFDAVSAQAEKAVDDLLAKIVGQIAAANPTVDFDTAHRAAEDQVIGGVSLGTRQAADLGDQNAAKAVADAQRKQVVSLTRQIRATDSSVSVSMAKAAAERKVADAWGGLYKAVQTNTQSQSRLAQSFPTLSRAFQGASRGLGSIRSRIMGPSEDEIANMSDVDRNRYQAKRDNRAAWMNRGLGLAFAAPMAAEAVGSMVGGSNGRGAAAFGTAFGGAVSVGAQFGPIGAATGAFVGLVLAMDSFKKAVAEADIDLSKKKIEGSATNAEAQLEKLNKNPKDAALTSSIIQNFKSIAAEEEKISAKQAELRQPSMLTRGLEKASFGFYKAARPTNEQIGEEETANQKVAGEIALKTISTKVESGSNIQEALASFGGDQDLAKLNIAQTNKKFNTENQRLENIKKTPGQDPQIIADIEKRQKELVNTYFKEETATLQATVAERSRVKALQQSARTLNLASVSISKTFDNMDQAIAAATMGLDKASQRIDEIASGQASLKTEFKSKDVLKNPNAYSQKERQTAISQVSGMFGTDKKFVEGLSKFGSSAEDTITKIAVQAQQTGASGEVLGENITRELTQQLIDTFGDNRVSDAIRTELKDAVQENVKKNNGVLDPQALIESTGGLKQLIDSQKKSFNTMLGQYEFIEKGLNQYGEAVQKAAELQTQAIGKFANLQGYIADSNVALKEALGEGRNISLKERASGAYTESAINAGVKPGSLTAANLTNQRTLLMGQQAAVQGNISKLENSGNAADPAVISLINKQKEALAGLNRQIAATEKGLETLPDLIRKDMENTKAKIEQLRGEKENKTQVGASFGEKLVTSTPTELKNLNSTYDLLNRTLNGQITTINQSVSSQQAYQKVIQDGGTHMEAVGAAQEAFASEAKNSFSLFNELIQVSGLDVTDKQKANNLRADLIQNTARNQGLNVENNPFLRDIIANLRAAPKEDPQIKALENLYKQQQAALGEATQKAINPLLEKQAQILNTANTALITALTNLTNAFNNAQGRNEGLGLARPGNVMTRAQGGPVYAASGTLVNYEPRGTDTVPAMLTPGEFVVNRSATQRNLPLLKSINSGNYAKGGVVYLAGGTTNPVHHVGINVRPGHPLFRFLIARESDPTLSNPRTLKEWKNAISSAHRQGYTSGILDPMFEPYIQEVGDAIDRRDGRKPLPSQSSTTPKPKTTFKPDLPDTKPSFLTRARETAGSIYERTKGFLSGTRSGARNLGSGLANGARGFSANNAGSLTSLGAGVVLSASGVDEKTAHLLTTTGEFGVRFGHTFATAAGDATVGSMATTARAGTASTIALNTGIDAIRTGGEFLYDREAFHRNRVDSTRHNETSMIGGALQGFTRPINTMVEAGYTASSAIEAQHEAFDSTDRVNNALLRTRGPRGPSVIPFRDPLARFNVIERSALERLAELERERRRIQNGGAPKPVANQPGKFMDEAFLNQQMILTREALNSEDSTLVPGYLYGNTRVSRGNNTKGAENKNYYDRAIQDQITYTEMMEQRTQQEIERKRVQKVHARHEKAKAGREQRRQQRKIADRASSSIFGNVNGESIDASNMGSENEAPTSSRMRINIVNGQTDFYGLGATGQRVRQKEEETYKRNRQASNQAEANSLVAHPALPPGVGKIAFDGDRIDVYKQTEKLGKEKKEIEADLDRFKYKDPKNMSDDDKAEKARLERQLSAKNREIIVLNNKAAENYPIAEQNRLWKNYEKKQEREANRAQILASNRANSRRFNLELAVGKAVGMGAPDKFRSPEAFMGWREQTLSKLRAKFNLSGSPRLDEKLLTKYGLSADAAQDLFRPFTPEQAEALIKTMSQQTVGGNYKYSDRDISILRMSQDQIEQAAFRIYNKSGDYGADVATMAERKRLEKAQGKTFAKLLRNFTSIDKMAARGQSMNLAQQAMLRNNISKQLTKMGYINPQDTDAANAARLSAFNINNTVGLLYPRVAAGNPAFRVAQGASNGGMIYAAEGALVNYQPRGTDTVPAMLTPGEFVVNAKATSQHLPLLQALNKSNGGVIYRAAGGETKSLSPTQASSQIRDRDLNSRLQQEIANNTKNNLSVSSQVSDITKTTKDKEIPKLLNNTQSIATSNAARFDKVDSTGQALVKNTNKLLIASRVFSSGGMVYASNGKLINYQPRGTDTVPAMLTPGEFVVNAQATSSNLPLLQAINKSKGGPVYLQKGGGLPGAAAAGNPNPLKDFKSILGKKAAHDILSNKNMYDIFNNDMLHEDLDVEEKADQAQKYINKQIGEDNKQQAYDSVIKNLHERRNYVEAIYKSNKNTRLNIPAKEGIIQLHNETLDNILKTQEDHGFEEYIRLLKVNTIISQYSGAPHFNKGGIVYAQDGTLIDRIERKTGVRINSNPVTDSGKSSNEPFPGAVNVTDPENLEAHKRSFVEILDKYTTGYKPGKMTAGSRKLRNLARRNFGLEFHGQGDVDNPNYDGQYFAYGDKTGSIHYRDKYVDPKLIHHELGHALVNASGQFKNTFNTKTRLQENIETFLKDPKGWDALKKATGTFYTAEDLRKDPREIFTNLIQAESTDAFKNNPAASELLSQIMKAYGFSKGGVVYAQDGRKVESIVPFRSLADKRAAEKRTAYNASQEAKRNKAESFVPYPSLAAKIADQKKIAHGNAQQDKRNQAVVEQATREFKHKTRGALHDQEVYDRQNAYDNEMERRRQQENSPEAAQERQQQALDRDRNTRAPGFGGAGIQYDQQGKPYSRGGIIYAQSGGFLNQLLGYAQEAGLQAESFAYGAAKSVLPTLVGTGVGAVSGPAAPVTGIASGVAAAHAQENYLNAFAPELNEYMNKRMNERPWASMGGSAIGGGVTRAGGNITRIPELLKGSVGQRAASAGIGGGLSLGFSALDGKLTVDELKMAGRESMISAAIPGNLQSSKPQVPAQKPLSPREEAILKMVGTSTNLKEMITFLRVEAASGNSDTLDNSTYSQRLTEAAARDGGSIGENRSRYFFPENETEAASQLSFYLSKRSGTIQSLPQREQYNAPLDSLQDMVIKRLQLPRGEAEKYRLSHTNMSDHPLTKASAMRGSEFVFPKEVAQQATQVDIQDLPFHLQMSARYPNMAPALGIKASKYHSPRPHLSGIEYTGSGFPVQDTLTNKEQISQFLIESFTNRNELDKALDVGLLDDRFKSKGGVIYAQDGFDPSRPLNPMMNRHGKGPTSTLPQQPITNFDSEKLAGEGKAALYGAAKSILPGLAGLGAGVLGLPTTGPGGFAISLGAGTAVYKAQENYLNALAPELNKNINDTMEEHWQASLLGSVVAGAGADKIGRNLPTISFTRNIARFGGELSAPYTPSAAEQAAAAFRQGKPGIKTPPLSPETSKPGMLDGIFEEFKQKSLSSTHKANGGMIYASRGTLVNYQPRGTDTVPAMLTPGEFVVNRQATQQNLPLLQSINNGNNHMSGGGSVYLADGGSVPVTGSSTFNFGQIFTTLSQTTKQFTNSLQLAVNTLSEYQKQLSSTTTNSVSNNNGSNTLNMDGLSQFTNTFNKFIGQLEQIKIPEQVSLQGTHRVDVVINGASVFANMQEPIQRMIVTEVDKAMNNLSRKTEGVL